LERDLGLRLFVRTSRHVELTEAGAAVLDDARELVARADGLLITARAHRRRCDDARPLRVGLFFDRLAAAELTDPILITFARRHPDTKVNLVVLDLATQHTAVRDGLVDVAIVRMPHHDSEVCVTPLFEEPRVAVCGARRASWGSAGRLAAHELDVLQRHTFGDHPSQPRDFNAFYQLSDVWDAAELTVAEIGPDSDGMLRFLATPHAAVVTAASWARTQVPHLGSAVLADIASSQVAVVARPTALHAKASAFTACAVEVTDQLCGLVPSAHCLAGSSPPVKRPPEGVG